MSLVTLDDIRLAHKRIGSYIHWTPVMTCAALDRISGAHLHFKCENFQKIGAFKIRGATNAVFLLDDKEAAKGVVTHSSGNHGAAVTQAAVWRGINATVVMPENSSEVKKQAVAEYGAKIIYCAPTDQDRQKNADDFIAESGATFIHPFNDVAVIAGQGTAAVELIADMTSSGKQLDFLLTPVGGGGLISGSCIATAALSPDTVIIGAEPQNADDAKLSLLEGRIMPVKKAHTIADGLRTCLGEHSFAIIRQHVSQILTASEQQIIDAMRLVWLRMKILIEPSAAVPLAAILANKKQFAGKRVGVIFSGGNVDLDALPF